MKIYSNIVPDNIVRETQLKALDIIADAVGNTFGPMGSHTGIVKDLDKNGANIDIKYTKDGHTVISNILFANPIERSVQNNIEDLTRYIVKEVGDGTTSAALLCRYVFRKLYESKLLSESVAPADLVKDISTAIELVKDEIAKNGRELNIDDIYKIALISTNNNEEISATIAQVYKKYYSIDGNKDIFIDVGISNTVENVVREYDGMVLDSPIADMCFINNVEKNSSAIRNPKIYAFKDPIDTPEMLSLLDGIIYNNILRAYNPNSSYEPVPTVIFTKKITPDASSYLESVVKLMNHPSYKGKIPLLIVSDIFQEDIYEDIVTMCGAPLIKKYLDPDMQAQDVEKGLAPTEETIVDFCGSADLVEADLTKTKIINPKDMFKRDENGEVIYKESEAGNKIPVYSDAYNAHVQFLQTALDEAIANSEGINTIGAFRRRLNSFKGCMIDFLVGGVASDKENLKASVEDAVLNCRSAAKYGVGYGANYMAFAALNKLVTDTTLEVSSGVKNILNILYDAYKDLEYRLYSCFGDKTNYIVSKSLSEGNPMNIRTKEYDKSVLSSIRSDEVILDTIEKILSLMFTCNQYLVQTPMHNIYTADLRDD